MSDLIERIAAAYAGVRARIERACERAGRNPADVTVVGVTKTKPVEVVRAAVQAGVVNLGENYAQEFHDKCGQIDDEEVRWHFIGHLQRNKAKLVLPCASLLHAVDSERLAAALDRKAAELDTPLPVLLQVNTSGEQSKYGVEPDQAPALARSLTAFPNLHVQGLMTLAAYLDDPEGTRPMFRLLRETRDRLSDELGRDFPHLSMGMTNDFEVAVEEGATLVRIGTALFGSR